MKKYLMVTPETFEKIDACFSDGKEIADFILQMDEFSNELEFCIQSRRRKEGQERAVLGLKQMCVFTLFCRDNIELIQQLISVMHLKEVTAEEIKKHEGIE